MISILKKSTKGKGFNFSYKERDNRIIAKDLGSTILEVCKITPGGVILLFQSPGFMRQIATQWDSLAISNNIMKYKRIFIEQEREKRYSETLSGFYKTAFSTGALLMATTSGDIMKGIDLSDETCRTIIQIGIPFPNLGDPKIYLKKEYLDKMKLVKKSKNILNGQKWYLLQSTRAVNQAIGRVVSHKGDYGNIILLDERYMNAQQKNQFSHWLKHSVKTFDDINKSKKIFQDFFKTMKKSFAPKTLRYDMLKFNYPKADSEEYFNEINQSVKKAAKEFRAKYGYLDDNQMKKGQEDLSTNKKEIFRDIKVENKIKKEQEIKKAKVKSEELPI